MDVRATAYKHLVQPIHTRIYIGSVGLDPQHLSKTAEAVQRRVARLTCGTGLTNIRAGTTILLQKLQLLSLSEQRCDTRLKLFSKYYLSSQTNIISISHIVSRKQQPHLAVNTTNDISFHLPILSTISGRSLSGRQRNGLICPRTADT